VLGATAALADMFPLTRQVQLAAASRGQLRPTCAVELLKPRENAEKTLGELAARIEGALAYVKAFKPQQIDGSEARESCSTSPQSAQSHREQYLVHFVLPNFYFIAPRLTQSCASAASRSGNAISSVACRAVHNGHAPRLGLFAPVCIKARNRRPSEGRLFFSPFRRLACNFRKRSLR